MSKKSITFIVAFIAIILNIFIIKHVDGNRSGMLSLNINISSNKEQSFQVFYSKDKTWLEEHSGTNIYNSVNTTQLISFSIPSDTKYIRLDFGNTPANNVIKSLYFNYKGNRINLDYNLIANNEEVNMISNLQVINGTLNITTTGEDPYCVVDINSLEINDFIAQIQSKSIFIKNIIICILLDLLLVVFLRFSERFITIPIELYQNRNLIFSLAKNDFRTKYAGSYLGIIWAFIQPVVTILVYWFVFQVGFKSAAVGDFPYVLWLITGLVPWFFFNDAITGGTNSLIEYSYLVKKVVFRISILPIVKIIAALFVHIFFVLFMMFLFIINGNIPDIYSIQIVYYLLCIFMLGLGISYCTSAIIIFFRDLGQIISIVLQVGMWMTPIMWNYSILPEKYLWLFKLNPMYYVVQGYRDALINKIWFWQNTNMMIYFWLVTIGLFAIGVLIFKRLRIHFADVL